MVQLLMYKYVTQEQKNERVQNIFDVTDMMDLHWAKYTSISYIQ